MERTTKPPSPALRARITLKSIATICTAISLGCVLGCVLVFCALNDMSALKNVERPRPILQTEPEHSCHGLDEFDREACQVLVGCVELQRRAKQAKMALYCTHTPERRPKVQPPRGPPSTTLSSHNSNASGPAR